MTRWTALMIQSHPDYTTESRNGIEVNASGPGENGKWAGWVSFWRDGRPHISPLISTEFVYSSAEEAKSEMNELIANIRKADLK